MNRRGATIVALVFAIVIWSVQQVGAAGFREQGSWQFRSAAELQTRLNAESLRLQVNGRNGSSGSTAIGLGSAALGDGSSRTAESSLNSTSGTTTYNVTVTGDRNDVAVEGYLNLETSQTSERVKSNVRNR